jgi:hypothetical protein
VAKQNGLENQRLLDVTDRMSSEAENARLKTLDRPLPRSQMPRIKPAVTQKLSAENSARVKH